MRKVIQVDKSDNPKILGLKKEWARVTAEYDEASRMLEAAELEGKAL